MLSEISSCFAGRKLFFHGILLECIPIKQAVFNSCCVLQGNGFQQGFNSFCSCLYKGAGPQECEKWMCWSHLEQLVSNSDPKPHSACMEIIMEVAFQILCLVRCVQNTGKSQAGNMSWVPLISDGRCCSFHHFKCLKWAEPRAAALHHLGKALGNLWGKTQRWIPGWSHTALNSRCKFGAALWDSVGWEFYFCYLLWQQFGVNLHQGPAPTVPRAGWNPVQRGSSRTIPKPLGCSITTPAWKVTPRAEFSSSHIPKLA